VLLLLREHPVDEAASQAAGEKSLRMKLENSITLRQTHELTSTSRQRNRNLFVAVLRRPFCAKALACGMNSYVKLM